MFRFRSASMAVVPAILALLLHPATAADNAADTGPNFDAHVLSERVLSVFEKVLDHHLDPPTQQSLVLNFCRTISSQQPKPVGLGKRVSTATRDEMRSIIEEQIAVYSRNERANAVNASLRTTLDRLASTRLIERSEHRVNEQLAANRYVGIGIALGMNGKRPAMMRVIEDGPADRGGARQGDLIVRVDGAETQGKKLREVIDMLRGIQGSKVDIVLQQPGKSERKLTLVRDVVPFKHVDNFRIVRPGIAAVSVSSISGSIVRDLRKLTPRIREQNIKGIVLEIGQGNPAHRPALSFANALIDGGKIGAIETSSGLQEVVADPGALWPGVAIAISHHAPAQDSLAWAFDALANEDRIFVDRFSIRKDLTLTPHAWMYETVAIDDESDDVLIMPTARLLGVNDAGDGYRQLDGSLAFGDPVNRAEASMLRRRSFGIDQHPAPQHSLASMIAVLQKMIAGANPPN